MSNWIGYILQAFTFTSAGAIALLCLLCYFKGNKALKILTVFYTVGICAEMLGYAWAVRYRTNLSLLHVYRLMEFIMLVCLFYHILHKTKYAKWIPWYLGFGIILITSNSIWLQPLGSINSYASTFVSISVIGLSIIYFAYRLHNPVQNPVERTVQICISTLFCLHSYELLYMLYGNNLLSLQSELTRGLADFRKYLFYVIRIILLWAFVKLALYLFIKKPAL